MVPSFPFRMTGPSFIPIRAIASCSVSVVGPLDALAGTPTGPGDGLQYTWFVLQDTRRLTVDASHVFVAAPQVEHLLFLIVCRVTDDNVEGVTVHTHGPITPHDAQVERANLTPAEHVQG